jgi:hypothetical protein
MQVPTDRTRWISTLLGSCLSRRSGLGIDATILTCFRKSRRIRQTNNGVGLRLGGDHDAGCFWKEREYLQAGDSHGPTRKFPGTFFQ